MSFLTKKEHRYRQFFSYLIKGISPKISIPEYGANMQEEEYFSILNNQYKKMSLGFRDGNENMTISIVIPVHIEENKKKFLMAITSLLGNESVPPTEIILVLNGKMTAREIEKTDIFMMSEKIGLKIIKLSYLDDEKYRDVRRPKNIFLARQAGADEARGSIIIAGDIDNIFSEYWINAYAKAFSRNPHLPAAYGPVGFYGTTGFIGRFMAFVSTFAKAAKILIDYPPYAGHNHAIRKEIFNRIADLYSEHILVHENEIPIILMKTLGLKLEVEHIACIPEAVILTDFGKQKQSLIGAFKWFLESAQRNIKQLKRMRRIE
jgi:hypothetical protein